MKHIEIQDLMFSYIPGKPVLENVNLGIYKNEIITLIGPNGGGKTSLLRLILGLLTPDSGTVRINGLSPALFYGKIGYVPQHTKLDSSFPMTVYDVVLSGMVRPFGFYRKKDKSNACRALEMVGLSSEKNRHFSNLSGGQNQRMLIARALVSEKEILLLDEPTSNIDPSAGQKIHQLLKDLGRKMTIILVTHDTGFVTDITDRVLCVNRTIVEHPLDNNFSEIIASSYGKHSSLVRHDLRIDGEEHKH